jgi:hypothetical protein
MTTIDAEMRRIVARAVPGAQLMRATVLGSDAGGRPLDETAKAAGYGVPIRLDVELDGQRRSFVLHGTSANTFGHDRRADRAAELLLAADTFANIPRHTRALDIGAFRSDGSSLSLADTGEFYLLTDYVDGKPYAEDLRRIAKARAATATDTQRVDTLVDYLVELHAPADGDPAAYQRSLRDLLGSGEGIFGIVDAYPTATPGAPPARLERIEGRCLDLRWKLKQREPRLTRVHGDFHPFNVLFDERGEIWVLDTSRGSLGDPADDVACMATNFVFFAIDDRGAWQQALGPLWRQFWARYLAQSGDAQLLSIVPPFLAWRLLVLACPVWYPNLSADARQRLLALAEAALEGERFEPELAEAAFR